MEETSYIPVESSLNDWLSRLIRFRWLIAISAFIIALTFNYRLPGALSFFPLLATVAALAIYNLIFLFCSRRLQFIVSYHNIFIHAQLVIDLLLITIFLHFLGGLETPFNFFYLIYIVIASSMLTRAASFVYVGIANILYLALLIFEWQGLIQHHNITGFRLSIRFQQPIHIFANSFALVIASLLIAYFASAVMARLRERERELMTANLSCELKTKELAETNLSCELKTRELAGIVSKLEEREQELIAANLSCELKTKELAEANLSCELKTKELAELNSRLEELDKVRTQFIWLITHELRAPVAGIQSYLKLILEGYVPSERQWDIIQKAERQAARQLDLIGDLLQLAKLSEPKTVSKVELVPVNIAEVLESVKDLMGIRAEENKISLNIQVEPDLSRVRANPEHIKQLWMNLISNAIKYTEHGGTVMVSLAQFADQIIGTVQDTGIGIAPEDIPHIFDNFYRARNAKTMEREGTGLGLSIVKRVIETYRGNISVESELEKGSKFTFLLPQNG